MSKRKLLLADDSITIQKVVNLTFADEGIDVETVGDGDSAMARLGEIRPDIVMVDVNMPGPNGYQICEFLRASEETRNIPVILLVGSFEPFDEGEAARVGANAYLTKPFQSIRQLIAQVNELIEASQPAAETPPAVDNGAITIQADSLPASVVEEPETVPITDDREPAFDPEQPPPVREFDHEGYSPTEDIDNLYSKSIGPGNDELADVGIDDEMLETSYTAEDVGTEIGEFDDVAESGLETEAAPQPTPEDLYAQPISLAPETVSVEEHASPEPFAGQMQDEQPHVYEPEYPARTGFETGPLDPEVQETRPEPPPFQRSSQISVISPLNYTPPVQTPEPVVETPLPEPQLETTEPFMLPVDPHTEAHTHSREEPQIPESETHLGEDTIRMDTRFDNTGSPNVEFQDVDILGLETGPIEITTPADAVKNDSDKQVVTLSPDLIEMIVQRVIEKMSEKYD